MSTINTNIRQSTNTIEELRVADQELKSGNTQGKVFVQLSPGAVAFQQERPVVQARVSRLIHEKIERDKTNP
jgi:hypothetical protein